MGGRGGSSFGNSKVEYRDPTTDIPNMSYEQLKAEYKVLKNKYKDRKERVKLEDKYIDAINTSVEADDLISRAYFEKNPEKKQKMLDRAKKKDELSEKKFSKIPDDYIRLKAIQVRLE